MGDEQCPEVRGTLRCTETYPHPHRSHDFWPMSETERAGIERTAETNERETLIPCPEGHAVIDGQVVELQVTNDRNDDGTQRERFMPLYRAVPTPERQGEGNG